MKKIFICFVFTLMITNLSMSQSPNNMNGCVGAYTFDNNLIDNSLSKNDGIAYGGKFTMGRNGKANSAYHFEGNGDYIEIQNKITYDFSVCFWTKTMQVGYNAEYDAFYGATGIIDNECIGCGNDFGIALLDNRVVFGIDQNNLPSTRYINSGQWVHIAAVRDSLQGKMLLYLNGKLDTMMDTPDYVVIDGTPEIYFGKLHAAVEDQKPFYNGDLDDVYIFSRALTEKEIIEVAYGANKPTGLLFNGAEVALNVPIILRSIQFDSGKSDLQTIAKKELDNVAKWLQQNPSLVIEISGHTSNDGDKATNNKLSLSRAEICRNYILTKGIEASHITIKGYGSDYPVVSNETEEGRQANRRVELKILTK